MITPNSHMNSDELFHTYPVFYTTISETPENIEETNVNVKNIKTTFDLIVQLNKKEK